MSIEQIVDVPLNGQVTIQLPSSLQNTKKVKLIINDFNDTLENKISLLKKASIDKDFLNDLREVNDDFEFAESTVVAKTNFKEGTRTKRIFDKKE